MLHDPWLDRWLPLIAERAGNRPVLEIGCGHGDDTVTLVNAGHQVVAFDLSRVAVVVAKTRAPSASIECRDVRAPLPAAAQGVGVVIASLSLHYFAWQETQAIVQRIREALRPGGLFLCRLNSTEDRNFGAQGHPEIEPGFHMVNGEPKRFFSEASVTALFDDGWKRLALEHFVTRKYVRAKALWEVAVERIG
jgi:SAM-dependent methyltransferase